MGKKGKPKIDVEVKNEKMPANKIMTSGKEDNKQDKVEDMRDKAEEHNYVCCLSCSFCDAASFERTDLAAYRAHLISEHGVTRNLEALLSLASQLQPG
jgi:hypothetical protein